MRYNGKGQELEAVVPAGAVFDSAFPAELVAADVRMGVVVLEAAERDYGVDLPLTGELDAEATQRLRG